MVQPRPVTEVSPMHTGAIGEIVDDATGESPDFECYKKAIADAKYNKDCKFNSNGY